METARNTAEEPVLPVIANLEIQVTEKNLLDLIDGQTIQIVVVGGLNLRMTLDKGVTRDVLVGIGNKAARDIPMLGRPSVETPAEPVLAPRTELTGTPVSI